MKRSWLPPRRLQVGAADCGPAVLASALRGFGHEASMRELRERLGADAEGTSIGSLERVAREYGLEAEEVMVPPEHILDGDEELPAIAVTLLGDGRTHFVLLWRRLGRRLLHLDPAKGLRAEDLERSFYVNEHRVPAAAWREWAGGVEFLAPLRRRLRRVGLSETQASSLLEAALSTSEVLPLASIDAAARAARRLLDLGGISRRDLADRFEDLLDALEKAEDPATILGAEHWSALPRGGEVLLRGVLLLRLRRGGVRPARRRFRSGSAKGPGTGRTPPPYRLAAALSGVLMAAEGLFLAGLAGTGAASPGLATGLVGAAALVLSASGGLDILAQGRALKAGRRDELEARIDLAERLPTLPDAVIASRSPADLTDRIHSAVLLRHHAYTLGGVFRSLAEMAAIHLGLYWLSQPAAAAAFFGTISALVALQVGQHKLAPLEVERRELGARLLTLAASAAREASSIAEAGLASALRAEHEGVLRRWSRVSRARVFRRGLLTLTVGACGAAATGMALSEGDGATLLLIGWWIFRLPSLGESLVGSMADLAAIGAARRRLEELSGPVAAPAEKPQETQKSEAESIRLEGVSLQLGNRQVLEELHLELPAGKLIALVGPSGAGKSSLLRLLAGIHPASSGDLFLSARRVLDPAELRLRTAFADPREELPAGNLAQLIARSSSSKTGPAAVIEVAGLEELSAADLKRPVHELPAGILARIRFARGVLRESCSFIALDEAFRDLQPGEARDLLGRLRRLHPRALILHATHDLLLAAEADRVVVLEAGRVVEEGEPAELRSRNGAFAAAWQLAEREPMADWQRR